jgi:cyclic lactone autoinducer peptide
MIGIKVSKSIINKFGGVIASFAFFAAVLSMRTACILIFHQPKVSQSLEKLKKV